MNYLGSRFGNDALTPYIITNPPVEPTNNLPTTMQSHFSNSIGTQTTNDFFQIGNDEAIVRIATSGPRACLQTRSEWPDGAPFRAPQRSGRLRREHGMRRNAVPDGRSGRVSRHALGLSLAFAASISFAPLAANAGTYSLLYSFTSGSDGAGPIGGVVPDAAGNLYGETYQGGNLSCSSTVGQPSLGCGTIYSLNPTGALTTLFNFTGPNGAYGRNGLTLIGSTLYGSTTAGGANDDGVLFSVHTDGSNYTVLHQFTGTDGKAPTGPLRSGPGGVFYGVTQFGGSSNQGALFQIKPDGSYAILHSFTGGTDGAQPGSLLYNPSGVLVGGTYSGGNSSKFCDQGCGLVYTYTPATGQFAVAHSFTGHDGGGPSGGPSVGSFGPGPVVYGNAGSIFSIGQKTGYKTIVKLDVEVNGGGAYSGPLYNMANGSLIGVNSGGPLDVLGYGDLYSVKNGVFSILHDFYPDSDGSAPYAQPILTSTGAIIGTTTASGLCTICGTIWKYTP